MRVLGVDGCRGGWVAVALEDGRFADSRFYERFADIAEDPAQIIGVDIPLGESTPGQRAAESAARAFLRHRHMCVFNPPPLECVEAETYDEANVIAQRLTGKKITQQAWNLLPKMIEATQTWCQDPKRFYEVHPECCFAAMAGEPLTATKKSWQGMVTRLRLLRDEEIDLLLDEHDPGRARHDDVIDAAAAAWTADRIARGVAQTLPEAPEHDADGRPVAIWY